MSWVLRNVIPVNQFSIYALSGSDLFIANEDFAIRQWNLASREIVNVLRGHKGQITDLEYSDDWKILFSTSVDGFMHAFFCGNLIASFMNRERRTDCFGAPLYSVAFNPKLNQILVGANSQLLVFQFNWELIQQAHDRHEVFAFRPITRMRYHTDVIHNVLVAGEKIVTTSMDRTVGYARVDSVTVNKILPLKQKKGICSIVYDEKNELVFIGTFDGKVHTLTRDGLVLQSDQTGYDCGVVSLAIDNSIGLIWAVMACGEIRLLDLHKPTVDLTDYFDTLKEKPIIGIDIYKFFGVHWDKKSRSIFAFCNDHYIFEYQFDEAAARVTINTKSPMHCMAILKYQGVQQLTTDALKEMIFSGEELIRVGNYIMGGNKTINLYLERSRFEYEITHHFPVKSHATAIAFSISSAQSPTTSPTKLGPKRNPNLRSNVSSKSRSNITSNVSVSISNDLSNTKKLQNSKKTVNYPDHFKGNKYIAFGDDKGNVACVKITTMQTAQTIVPLKGAVSSIHITPRHIIATTVVGSWDLFNLDLFPEPLEEYIGREMAHNGAINDSVFDDDTGTLITVGTDGLLKSWELTDHVGENAKKTQSSIFLTENDKTLSETSVVDMRKYGEIKKIVWAKKADKWITVHSDRQIRVWTTDINNIALLLKIPCGGCHVTSIAIDDPEIILAAIEDKTIRCFNMKNGDLLRTYIGHKDQICCVAADPNINYYVSSSWDGAVKIWTKLSKRITPAPSILNDITIKPKTDFNQAKGMTRPKTALTKPKPTFQPVSLYEKRKQEIERRRRREKAEYDARMRSPVAKELKSIAKALLERM